MTFSNSGNHLFPLPSTTDTPDIMQKDYVFKIMPFYLKQVYDLLDKNSTKSPTTTLDSLKNQFENSFKEAETKIMVILLQRDPASTKAILEFAADYAEFLQVLAVFLEDFFSKFGLDDVEETSIKEDEEIAATSQLLHRKFPEYSLEAIKTILSIFHTMHTINYFQFITSSSLIENEQLNLEVNAWLAKNKSTLEEVMENFCKVITNTFPSLNRLHRAIEREYKLKNSRKTTEEIEKAIVQFFQKHEYFNIDETTLLNHFLEDMPNSWKKSEKNVQNVKLNANAMGEIYFEYLTLYHFYIEISVFFPIVLTVTFSQTAHLPGLLRAIVHANKLMDTHLALEAPTPNLERLKTKAKDRVVKLPNDSHALSAFSIPIMAREFGYDLSQKENFQVNEHAKDPQFKEMLISSQLINLYFSQILTTLEVPFVKEATHEKIPFEKIEKLFHPDGEFYAYTGIKEIATYLSKQADRSVIERILRQSAARSLIGIDVLLQQSKHLQSQLMQAQVNNSQLQQQLDTEIENNQLQVKQAEELELLEIRLQNMKKERDDIQKSFHEVSRLISPFDELKVKHEAALNEIELLKAGQADLARENEQLDTLIKAYLAKNDDDDALDEQTMTSEEYLNLHLAYLLDQKIAIIGGHEKWRTRINQLLPNARIFIPEHLNVSLDMISRADLVIFNTATTNHSIFMKLKEIFRRNTTGKFVYINTRSSNMLRTLTNINEQLQA